MYNLYLSSLASLLISLTIVKEAGKNIAMENETSFTYALPLQELPNLSEDIFFAFDLQINKLVYLNKSFETIWQISRHEVKSNMFLLFESVHPDDRELVTDAFLKMKEQQQKQRLEFRILPSGETLKWIRVNAYFSDKGNENTIVGIATDITAYKDYSDTLHKFADKKNSVLQILSHDLLGPLGNIQMSTTLLLEDEKFKNEASVLKLLEAIDRSSKRSVTLIRDLINEEFLETSETAFVKQRIDIIEKLRIIIDQYNRSVRPVPARFEFLTPVKSLFINIDESKFIQAINNLLSNALKFTPDNGKIEVSIEEKEEKVLITVHDEGIGIPAQLQPFLFDKFTKARREGINGEATTGLGMSIIKTIVEWHKGHIWFESTEGKGSTFYIELPKDA